MNDSTLTTLGDTPIAFFADNKKIRHFVLQNLNESFTVLADSFHICPLLDNPQYFLTYRILLLHSDHIACYYRNSSGVSELFKVNRTPQDATADSVLELGGEALKNLQGNDGPLVVFGPQYMRKRLRRRLEKTNLPPPIFEGDAIGSLSSLIEIADARVIPQLEATSESLIEEVTQARKSGRFLTDLQLISHAVSAGAIEKLVIQDEKLHWGEWDPKNAEFKSHKEQMTSHDDCILDDLAEMVMEHQGAVTKAQPLPGMENVPAYAILRWQWHEAVAK